MKNIIQVVLILNSSLRKKLLRKKLELRVL